MDVGIEIGFLGPTALGAPRDLGMGTNNLPAYLTFISC